VLGDFFAEPTTNPAYVTRITETCRKEFDDAMPRCELRVKYVPQSQTVLLDFK